MFCFIVVVKDLGIRIHEEIELMG